MDKLLHTHHFVFNENDNGGEHLILTTKYYDNGDGIPNGIYTNQIITLQSYGNSSSFNLCGVAITSDLLRILADSLDAAKEVASKNK